MVIPFAVNPDSPVPLFDQIADGLRAAIARGVYPEGGLLPSVRALAAGLEVNPNTVHRAVGKLEQEGLVVADRGRGMVVRSGISHSARVNGADAALTRLVDALRHAQSIGLDHEQLLELLERARTQIGWPGRGGASGANDGVGEETNGL